MNNLKWILRSIHLMLLAIYLELMFIFEQQLGGSIIGILAVVLAAVCIAGSGIMAVCGMRGRGNNG